MMIGMLLEEGLDLLTVEIQLQAQGAQEFAQAHGQLAFGRHDGSGGFELIGLRENLQALFGGFGPPEFMRVQEFLPAALASFNQGLRRGEGNHKFPGKILGPIIKGLQSGRIIFSQRLLELVDQGGALLDERDFIATEQAQLLGQRIAWLKHSPAVAIDPERIG